MQFDKVRGNLISKPSLWFGSELSTLKAKNSLVLGEAVKGGGDNELGGNINGLAHCSIFGRWTD